AAARYLPAEKRGEARVWVRYTWIYEYVLPGCQPAERYFFHAAAEQQFLPVSVRIRQHSVQRAAESQGAALWQDTPELCPVRLRHFTVSDYGLFRPWSALWQHLPDGCAGYT